MVTFGYLLGNSSPSGGSSLGRCYHLQSSHALRTSSCIFIFFRVFILFVNTLLYFLLVLNYWYNYTNIIIWIYIYIYTSQVKLIDFSPGEKYLVTYSSHEPSNPRDANVSVFFFVVPFWDFRDIFPNYNILSLEGCDKHIWCEDW